jgi:hypothetical protein
MNFANVKLLTYEHKNNFWGDKTFRYGSTISMSVKGYVLSLSKTFGVKDVFSACVLLSDSLGSPQDIVINNQSYGVGKIKKVEFDSGNWVKATEYTASIEIVQEGSIFDFGGEEFEQKIIDSIKGGAYFLEDFSEAYSVDYSSSDDSISGIHSVDVRMSTLYSGDKILFAKNLASVIFSKTFVEKLSQNAYSKPPESLRKDYYSENYNTINGACGFKRSFSYSNTSECFSRKRSIVVSLGEDGITNVTESNSIQGECLNSTLFESAEAGFSSEISGAYARCLASFAVYKGRFGIVNNLINKELERSVKNNRFTGEIEYSVTFTNDKKRKGYYSYEYTLDLSRSEDFVWNVTEAGSVNGDGAVGSSEKFDKALDGWDKEKENITSRVGSFYSSNASIKPISSSLKFITKNVVYSPFDGAVSYSWSYTDDLTLNMDGDIRRISIDITDSDPVRIHNDFIIPGGASAYSIAQASMQSKQGERDIKGSMEIASSVVPFSAYGFFQSGVNIANANRGSGSDLYLDSFSFSSDEIEQSVEFNAKYKYSSGSYEDLGVINNWENFTNKEA